LKSAVEALLVERSMLGPKVIDVGIGTGRGVLPLLDKGYAVTGIDSTPTMFADLRQLAGGRAIDLRVGDLGDLPCREHEYDSLFSLNVLEHTPDWRGVVARWKKVVKPGGIIAFDLLSAANPSAVYGADRERWPQGLVSADAAARSGGDGARASFRDVVDFARKNGVGVASITPYGIVGSGNCLIRDLEMRSDWARLLSWLAADDDLLELGLFLELFIAAPLTPRLTGRMFVVLVNEESESMNDAALHRHDVIDAALAARDLVRAEEFLPLRGAELRKALSRLLVPLRSRAFLLRLYASARKQGVDIGLLLEDEMRAWCEKAYRASEQDRALVGVLHSWRTSPHLKADEAALASVLGYPMAPKILEAFMQRDGWK
jgi:SAM-dependent methyltransferase